MEQFELSNSTNDLGQRKFKLILHKIQPDSCVVGDEGTLYNVNGITWIKEYCEKALPSLINKSITAEFLNPEKTEVCGHGMTGMRDGVPVFENAETIGHFTNAYLQDVEMNGEIILAAIGEGYIDEFRYKNLCDKLRKSISNGKYPKGSVEICRKANQEEIVYKYGFKKKGRIPMEFDYSGWALLGLAPADDSAIMIELNNKEEKMDIKEIKNLIAESITEYVNAEAKVAEANSACETKLAEINQCKEELETKLNEAKETKQADEDKVTELQAKVDELKEENEKLKGELAECKSNAKKKELCEAIKDFSESEQEYAKTLIETFNAQPLENSIEAIVSKIYEGIGKASKEAEINQAPEPIKVDILASVNVDEGDGETVDIFAKI